MYFSQLLLGYISGCAAHQILCGTAHGECDYLADVLFVAKQHDHTVHAGCHTCMRGSTKLECLIQGSEFRLQSLLVIARDFKCLYHNIQVMISHCTGGKLHTVADNIILVSQDLQRILVQQCIQTSLGHGERIVGKANLLGLLIQLEHREVIHIAETICILLAEIQLVAKLNTKLTCIVVCLLLLICNEEQGISRHQSCKLTKLNLILFGNKFINRSLVAQILSNLQVTKSAHTHIGGKL